MKLKTWKVGQFQTFELKFSMSMTKIILVCYSWWRSKNTHLVFMNLGLKSWFGGWNGMIPIRYQLLSFTMITLMMVVIHRLYICFDGWYGQELDVNWVKRCVFIDCFAVFKLPKLCNVIDYVFFWIFSLLFLFLVLLFSCKLFSFFCFLFLFVSHLFKQQRLLFDYYCNIIDYNWNINIYSCNFLAMNYMILQWLDLIIRFGTGIYGHNLFYGVIGVELQQLDINCNIIYMGWIDDGGGGLLIVYWLGWM